jgi:hypothetical protein
MTVKVTKRKPGDTDWEHVDRLAQEQRDTSEREWLARQGIRPEQVERQIQLRKDREHQCNVPQIADDWGPGTVFRCDYPSCKREKVVVVGAPSYETSLPQLVWRNL